MNLHTEEALRRCMGKYDGYLQGLSIAAILILAPLALQTLLTQDEAQIVYVAVPVEVENQTANSTPPNDDARAPELNRSEVARIATFNIKVFGETKMGKPDVVAVLVDTVLRYDLVAVQEIKNIDQTVPYDFLDAINNQSQSNWSMMLSVRSGLQEDDRTSQEQYAFYYNTEVFEAIGNGTVYNDSEKDLFQREPFQGRFVLLNETGNHTDFDLSFITIHTKPAAAVDEIDALGEVASTYLEDNPDEDDLVILGDFNADCSYASEQDISNSALAGGNYTWLVGNDADTTVSRSSCAYDRILTNGDLSGRLTSNWGIDRVFEDSNVSDHYPVWFDIRR
jgi:endonuclease/exonuclease/phosphatase family metal-dependent hydrolase